jgi:hypothetical protein
MSGCSWPVATVEAAVATGATRLDLGLLGDFQGIVQPQCRDT